MDYTKCAKRLLDAFYHEFTDWEAVFGVVEQNIDDHDFIQTMFNLLKVVYSDIKIGTTPAESEELLRTHAQSAIQCLNRIDRQLVDVDIIDRLICAILNTDKELKLIGIVSF